MSKKRKKKQHHRYHSPTKSPAASNYVAKMGASGTKDLNPQGSRLDYLAILPGLLLCVMTFIVLLLDVFIAGMAKEQYTDYPSLFRLTNGVIIAAGVVYWMIHLRQNGICSLDPRRMQWSESFYVLFFALFLIGALLSTAVNGLDEAALHGIPYRNIGVFHMIAFFLIYAFLSAKLGADVLRCRLLGAFLILADALAMAALVDQYVQAIPAFAQKKELSAIFFNGNHYGYFLTMAILMGVGFFIYQARREWRLLGLVSMLLNLVVLMLNHSLGCILAVGVVLLVILILSLLTDRVAAKRLLVLLVGLAGVFLAGLLLLESLRSEFVTLMADLRQIAAGDEASSTGHNRWMLWALTWELISERPWLGYGCEGIFDLLMTETGRGNPHNELLTYAAFYGIPAALFYVLGIISVWVAWVRSRIWEDPCGICAALAALGYFLSSLFGVALFYTSPFFFIFLGISLSKREHVG